MATAQEKEALGLGPEATDEEVAQAIADLKAQADSTPDAGTDTRVTELEEQLRATQEERDAANSALQDANDAGATAATTEQPQATAGDAYPHEVTLKIRAFPYYVDINDPVTGRQVRQERVATRGQTVRLSDVDFERGERFNAFQTDVDEDLQEATGAFSLNTISEGDLAVYIRDEKPTISDLVDGVNEDPVLARKVLDAENLATGQQPRQGLVDALEELAADAPVTA